MLHIILSPLPVKLYEESDKDESGNLKVRHHIEVKNDPVGQSQHSPSIVFSNPQYQVNQPSCPQHLKTSDC